MSWPLRLVEVHADRPVRIDGQPFQVGDCYFARWMLDPASPSLGAKYLTTHRTSRPPIVIVLPGSNHWCPDQKAYDRERRWHGNGWDVSGELPAITCAPSINCIGSYHGYVQKGVITDDCEGRKFTAEGVPVASGGEK